MSERIRIPFFFYQDHRERDLDTPVNYAKSKSYAVIDSDDPALPELISDAWHYASDGGGEGSYFDCGYGGYVLSARATLKAIRKHREEVVLAHPEITNWPSMKDWIPF